MALDKNAVINYYFSSYSQLLEQNMFSFDYGLPVAIVITLILLGWLSFLSVVFA
jgi:hypothetical protein